MLSRLRHTIALATLVVALPAVIPAASNAQAPTSGAKPTRALAPAQPSVTKKKVGSTYYTLTLATHSALVPAPDRPRAGGAVATYGDGFLLVTAAGEFYRLSWEAGAGTLKSERLPLVVPFNRKDLLAAVTDRDATNPFRITGLLVEERDGNAVIYVSHHHWDKAAQCVSLRVSKTMLSSATSGAAATWSTVFDSKPCLPLGKMWPKSGGGSDESGGRMARHPEGLLLTVGDHGFDGIEDAPRFSQDPDTSYGKILLIDDAGTAVPFSLGHRNPQGLTIASDGRIWESEHGPEGGDEINVIVKGANYGWPLVTYGTEYRSDVWPLSPTSRNHGKFHEPAVAFVPSIGPSAIVQLRSNYLPHWSGDLLLATLRAGLLYRVRTSGDAVVYTEAINVDMRMRDIAEGRDGRILIWGDDGQVYSLTLDAPTHGSADSSRQ